MTATRPDKFTWTEDEAASLEIVKNPQCLSCAWFDRHDIAATRCRVFPNGIPMQIYTNRADHRLPYPGDNGWRWTPIETPTEEP